jgi:AraC-like DNA-binding protein
MKKFLLKVTSGPGYSFSLVKEEQPFFYDVFHFHPQLELNLVLKGKGTRFVGDSIERFYDGDLILLGSNLPHVWKCDKEFYTGNKNLKCLSSTIHFDYGFLGEDFFDHPEFRKIKDLLTRSSAGIKLIGKLRQDISNQMELMIRQSQTERLITLLDILRRISISKGIKILSSRSILHAYKPHDSERIKKVHQYIVTHFKDQIKLEDVAKAASMSPTAFCRYFKQRTRKTFSHFITEVRVGYACQLLQQKKMKIAQVCYESGYSNLSNFNKQFKATMHLTPVEYAKTIQ